MNSTLLPSSNDGDYSENENDFCLEGKPLLDQAGCKVIFICLYVVVFCCCFIGNIIILCVIGLQKTMRNNTNFLLANLALCDLLVAIFCVLQNLMQLFIFPDGHWPLGKSMCHTYIFVLHLVPCTSSGILVLVCVERYIAVLHPIAARHIITMPKLIAATVLVWLISVICNIPYLVSAKYFKWSSHAACGRDYFGAISIRDLNTVSFVLWYCIPLATMCILYSRISIVLWKSTTAHAPTNSFNKHDNHRQNGHKNVPNDDESTQMLHQNRTLRMKMSSGEKRMEESRRKVIRMLIAVVTSFSLLTLTHYVRMLWLSWMPPSQSLCLTEWSVLVQPISYLLLFMNSGINPFLYAFLSVRFREALFNTIKCRLGPPCPSLAINQTRRRSNRSIIMNTKTDECAL